MSLSYCAANYFIEALCLSPTYNVSYDYLKILRSLVSKEIAEYLDKKSKDDYLYIFKIFPDVFVLKKESVALTDPFLSLYELKKSFQPNQSYRNDYLETSALLYFNNILKCYGPQHFLSLFNFLANDITQQFAGHFRQYSVLDAFNFFQAHSDVFLLFNEIVSMNAKKAIIMNPLLSDKVSPVILKKIADSVYFLLTCFESLHYIELKQCISYVIMNAEHVLDQYPLIKQREWFKKLPYTQMNELGFLHLKNFNINLSISDTHKVILIAVCILAFQKQVPFQEMVKEVKHRIYPTVVNFCNVSLEEQFTFFQQYPEYFRVSVNKIITLLPKFFLPICSFETPKFTSVSQNTLDELKSVVSYVPPKNLNDDRDVHLNSQNGGVLITLNNNPKGIMQNENTSPIVTDCKNSFNGLGLPESVIKRTKISIAFLWKYALPVDYKCILKTILHVLKDVRISFCKCAETDKRTFITVCCQFMDMEPYKRVGYISHLMLEEIKREKNLLLITHCLTNTTTLHFEKIVKSMTRGGIDSPFAYLSISEQFNYFKAVPGYMKIENDGYVSLTESFNPIRSMIDSHFDIILANQSSAKHYSLQDTNTRCALQNKTIKKDGILSKTVVNQNCVSRKVSEEIDNILNESSSFQAEVKLPESIYKILCSSTYLFRKYFRDVVIEHALESSLIALNDLYEYVCNLSTNYQYKFIEKCYQFIYSKALHGTLSDYQAVISREEETLLLIAYLLSKEKILHFQKIIKRLDQRGFHSQLYHRNVSNQFKYFKEKSDYFMIKSDGYVTLKSTLQHLKATILAVKAFVPKTLNKVKQSDGQTSADYSQNSLRQTSKDVQFSVKFPNLPSQSKCTDDKYLPKKETVRNSVELDTKNAIIDLSFFILSVSKKMPTEKLCYRLSSCNIKSIHEFFSFFTVSEKLKFFKDLSQYFDVTTDGFVSLKENSADAYVFKTNLNPSEVFNNSISASKKSFYDAPQKRSESVKSSDFSDSLSVDSCNSQRKKERYRNLCKKQQALSENDANNLDNGKIKISPKAESNAAAFNNLDNSRKISFSQSSLEIKISKNASMSSTVINSEFNFENKTGGSDKIPDKTEPGMDKSGLSCSEAKNACDKLQCYDGKLSNQSSVKIHENCEKNRSVDPNIYQSESNSCKNNLTFCDKTKDLSFDRECSGFQTSAKSVTSLVPKCAISSSVGKTEKSNVEAVSVGINKCKSTNVSNKKNSTSKDLSIFENPTEYTGVVLSTNVVKASKGNEISPSTYISDNNFDCDILQCDSSYEAYISELIDSFVENLKFDSSTNGTYFKNIPTDHIQTLEKPQSVHSKIDSYHIMPNVSILCDMSPIPVTSDCSSLLEKSVSRLTKNSSFNPCKEFRAVNFFCVLLRNCCSGVSTEFLKKHLHLASLEVRNFMHDYFKNDLLSFFQKHKKVFYVSPQSHNIYLVKNSSNN